jgi:hypothetical protein
MPYRLAVLAAGLLLAACSAGGLRSGPPAPAPGLERSALFRFGPGDRLEDSGRMVVPTGRFARTEHFEVVRRADGGRTVTSVIIDAAGSYRVEGRWTWDAREQALTGSGTGAYGGEPISVDLRGGPDARIAVTRGGQTRTTSAPCDACLIDMTPSTQPMFALTRRYGREAAGEKTFRWIAQSLLADEILLDGRTEVNKLGDATFQSPGGPVAVRQYAFVETLKNETTGAIFQLAFNLYVGADDDRPLAFAIGGGTVGERAGFEGITRAIPAKIPAVRPPGG